eukprot:scaffold129521_cov13-Tisochrysis_lutea.AAC.1
MKNGFPLGSVPGIPVSAAQFFVSQKQHLNARIKAAVHDMNEIEKTAKQRSTGKIALMSPK